MRPRSFKPSTDAGQRCHLTHAFLERDYFVLAHVAAKESGISSCTARGALLLIAPSLDSHYARVFVEILDVFFLHGNPQDGFDFVVFPLWLAGPSVSFADHLHVKLVGIGASALCRTRAAAICQSLTD